MTIWKAIEGFNNYEVSNEGEIFSKFTNRVLKQIFDSDGYCVVNLYNNKKMKTLKVHRLVANAFIPNPENKPQVNHKNGIKSVNHDWNLEWATPQEDREHAVNILGHGTGEKNGAAILTQEQVLTIRKDNRVNYVIANEYGVSQSLISAIKRKEIWKHI